MKDIHGAGYAFIQFLLEIPESKVSFHGPEKPNGISMG